MGINFGNMNSTTSASPAAAPLLDLNKGVVLDLTKVEPGLTHVKVGAGWDANNSVPAFDLDLSVFLLNSNMKITGAHDIVFFNNKSASGVTLSGDNRTGDGEGDDETVIVNLNEVPANVQAIDFVINIFEAQTRRQTFGMVHNSYIHLMDMDQNDKELCRFPLKEDYGSSTAVIVARLVRNGTTWNFQTIGEGKVVKDLNDIAAMYM